jgi:hypothetical protein
MFKGYVNITIRNIDWSSSATVYLENDIVWQDEGHIKARCMDFYYFIEAQLKSFVDNLEFNPVVGRKALFDLSQVKRLTFFENLKAVAYHNIVDCEFLSGKEQVKLAVTLKKHWECSLNNLERSGRCNNVYMYRCEFAQIIDYIEQYAKQVEQQLK